MIMRLILWLSVLWIAPLVSGVLVNDAKFKKNLAVGVTIPPEFQADPDIAAHLARSGGRSGRSASSSRQPPSRVSLCGTLGRT